VRSRPDQRAVKVNDPDATGVSAEKELPGWNRLRETSGKSATPTFQTSARPRSMNAKAKGSRNERRSRVILESAGYVVTRAAASLGCWDLVGIGSTDIVLVQCKTRDWPSAVELEALQLFPAPPNARKLVHRWRDRERRPDVRELA
jgi:hypothetical protein